MPFNAIESAGVDHVLPVAQIPTLLERLVVEPPDSRPAPASDLLTWETRAILDQDARIISWKGRAADLWSPSVSLEAR